ncbi:MAG: tetratricopeptide repeat protein [Treponema sp.]|jgi:tetratricopeptide (TPR) repeat protein|nr:tetratricopeptide repeat protein [Treponema sp.]
MFYDKNRSGYGLHLRRKRAIYVIVVVIAVVVIVAIPVPYISKAIGSAKSERKELLRLWDAGAFEDVFNLSKTALESKPMDYFLLTLHGFSAYQMGISQINNLDRLNFFDECIMSLRKALLLKQSADDGRVYYVLGKAYSYKDNYADYAVQYLERARTLSYQAADIPEYLGIAYAAIGDYRSSVAAFAEALEPPAEADNGDAFSSGNPPYLLLLSIARSYSALNEFEAARAYLLRCIEISPDSKTKVAARLLLAEILQEMGESRSAEDQYLAILDEAGENAEAHYQLGEIYAQQGDATKARSEWRLAYRTDPAHAKARARLNM